MQIIVKDVHTEILFENNEDSLQKTIHKFMRTHMGIKQEGIEYSKAYRMGWTDGIVAYYHTKTDTFPTGLLFQFIQGIQILQEKYPHMNITYDLKDFRKKPIMNPETEMDDEIELDNPEGEPIILRDYQYAGVKSILNKQIGILALSTSSGKSEIAAGIIQELLAFLQPKEKIVFVVPKKTIAWEIHKRLQDRLGIEEIGMLGDGKKKIRTITVAIDKSLNKLVQSLDNPIDKKDVNLTPGEKAVQFIAEQVTPRFEDGKNVRKRLQQYIKNNESGKRVWQDSVQQLTEIAYSNAYTDATAKNRLKSFRVEYDKILKKKNKKAFDKYEKDKEFVESVRLLIIDEAHHIQGESLYNTCLRFPNATYRVGLTGSIDYDNKMQVQRLWGVFGSVVGEVRNKELIDRDVVAKPTIHLLPITEPDTLMYENDYHKVYENGIVRNDHRNKLIAKVADIEAQNQNGTSLISVTRIEHGESLSAMMEELGISYHFLHGDIPTEEAQQMLEDVRQNKVRVLISTTVVQEGVSINNLSSLIYAGGGKSLTMNLQFIGRVLRRKEGDNVARVYDFLDKTNKYLLAHSKKRKTIYENEEFEIKHFDIKDDE